MKISVAAAVVSVSLSTLCAQGSAWEHRVLVPEFFAEGAGVGDINGDGKVDIAYGPFWLEGPKFEQRHRFAPGDSFDGGRGYSDNFFSFVRDFNGDGKNDILVFGFPGKAARLYINGESENWAMVEIADQVANESPHLVDLIPGGLPEIVCARDKAYGYFAAGEVATEPWVWHSVSAANEAATPFGHGLGVGDVNGDGRDDLVEKMFWYEQPAEAGKGPWKKHKWAMLPYGGGGAQILIDDLDGDKDNDIITSLNAHGYGLAWFEQTEPGKFARHDIMGTSSTENAHGVAFSQLHAMALADVDGDGRKDFVTGKRYFAHQGKDPGGLQEPVLYWFQNTATGEGIEFVPHFVDNDSGVGVEVNVTDINGDQKPDIVTSSKKGLMVHTQTSSVSDLAVDRWKAPEGRPQDGYGSGLDAAAALKRIEVPEGFTVDLVAAEPEVTQPIAMTFDSRGRIWVIEGHTYPQKAPEGEGRDRILIFEDSDGDGSFDKRKVFAEGINLASGIEVGFGGVYVGAAPQLLFFPDNDQNDVPDGEPEVLLDGWGFEDTHETLNAFTWGPDGWLYGCHGVFTHSKVGRPGTPAEERIPINAGVWRFHPVSKQFEVFAHGSSNPWGVDFNEYGDWFISACVIPHFYHLSHGGRYQRQAGQHFDPFSFDDIKTIADHAHYTGSLRDHAFWGANSKERRPSPNDTSALGGGHAHCGLAIYQADEFPASFRGEPFFHNLHGHRIVRERLECDGSGYVAKHRPDFVLTNNHDFVGVGMMQGPDGAIYFSDWVDTQTCHHRDVEIWDRANGRIFRVRYGDAKSTVLNLPDLSDGELVATLKHSNAFQARQAQRLLQERAAAGVLKSEVVEEALDDFDSEFSSNTALRLRALWTRHVTGLLTGARVMASLSDSNEYIRAWAVQLATPDEVLLKRFSEMAQSEESLIVRRYLASRLQRLPLNQRWDIVEGLIRDGRSKHDRNIPLLCWYGISPLVEADPEKALQLVSKTDWPQLKDFMTRRAAVFPEGRDALMHSLSQADEKEFFDRTKLLLESLSQLPPVEMPTGWAEVKERAGQFSGGHGRSMSIARLGARFGDPAFFPEWRKVVSNPDAGPPQRIEALELLTIGKDPELGTIARASLESPFLRPAAIAALRRHPGEETAKALVDVIDQLSLKMRNEAINLLASRPDMAQVLLVAVDQKKVEPALISPVLLDQFERFNDETINVLIDRNWVRGGDGVDLAELTAAIGEWKGKLNSKVMARADASRGRQVYTATCGTCHQLFGEGIALGPDLTGSNRADLAYVLENVLAPSAVVGKAYMLNIFSMKDGSTISGMVKAETPEFITVAMPGGTQTDVSVKEIEERQQLAQSLMPPGLFEAMPLEQVADLVKYLGSPNQVSLSGTGKGKEDLGNSDVPPPGEGVTRIEAESLVGKSKPGGGQVRTQMMSGFGPSWSGNGHLWWTGGTPGNILTLKLEGIAPGTHDVDLFTTAAHDYATIKVAINGQLQEADLYSEKVEPGKTLHFKGVNVSPGEPLQIDIHITGMNEVATPRYMVGLDRIELKKHN
ncbi:PVC-type heme-binding CxxCH protein [Verrucomicrobiales bacterium BCK34]|nr:PVC-type heme-binding CxxCH protein [Verrucomicrobiales bacterium BCK34]